MSSTLEQEQAQPDSKTITRNQSLTLLASSIVTAAASLIVTIIAKHALEGAALTEFLLFWSVLFTITGIITGIQPETTRAVGAARRNGVQRARVVYVAGAFGAAAGLAVVLTSPLWAPGQVPTSMPVAVGLIALGVACYALQAAVSGASAGENAWYLFAGIGGVESVGRLAVMAGAVAVLPTLAGMEAAVVIPMILWALLIFSTRSGRKAWAARADTGAKQLSINLVWSFLSSAAAAVLMMGFPAILKVSERELDEHTSMVMAALILAISITRSPIMLPLQAFQGVAVSAFLKHQHRPAAAFAKPAAALLGIGMLGAAAAWLVGPWLFRLIYPPKPNEGEVYAQVITGAVLAELVFASAVLALIALSGNMVLAISRHRAYVAGWAVAALVAIAVACVLPAPLVERALVALYAGPACGFAVHLAAMIIHARHTTNHEAGTA